MERLGDCQYESQAESDCANCSGTDGIPAVAPPRLIAFYLPQFHPIPENDAWWGKGFTEWTNVGKARPLFPGHDQPRVPADLGYYDLRVPEIRVAQASMARANGIEAFCYYHYWFAGKQLLERPFNEVVSSGDPDFPFCVCWANQTWTGIWHGSPGRILIEQTYPGDQDHRTHFDSLLPAFCDRRYVRIEGKPVFVIYRPMELPSVHRTIALWQDMASKAGLPGLHFVGVHENPGWRHRDFGFDAAITPRLPGRRGWISKRHVFKWLRQEYELWRGFPTIVDYCKALDELLAPPSQGITNYPCIIPNWDNTPRSGMNGLVLRNATPELFRRHFREALEISRMAAGEGRLIFVKSWNEWAEGNYLEPDLEYGMAYLDVISDELVRERSLSDCRQFSSPNDRCAEDTNATGLS